MILKNAASSRRKKFKKMSGVIDKVCVSVKMRERTRERVSEIEGGGGGGVVAGHHSMKFQFLNDF